MKVAAKALGKRTGAGLAIAFRSITAAAVLRLPRFHCRGAALALEVASVTKEVLSSRSSHREHLAIVENCAAHVRPPATHQCAFRTASTVVIPAIIEPVIPTSAGVPRGNSRLMSEAMKIAAIGRAMTK